MYCFCLPAYLVSNKMDLPSSTQFHFPAANIHYSLPSKNRLKLKFKLSFHCRVWGALVENQEKEMSNTFNWYNQIDHANLNHYKNYPHNFCLTVLFERTTNHNYVKTLTLILFSSLIMSLCRASISRSDCLACCVSVII